MHNSVLFLFVYSMHKLVALFLCKEDSIKLKKKVKQTIKVTEISHSTNTHIMKGAHPPGGRTPIWNGWGCLSEILNLTPKRDQSGRGRSLCRPPKEKYKESKFFLFCYFFACNL